MAIVVPAVTGPFNLGNVVTRATIAVEPNSPYRVVVTSGHTDDLEGCAPAAAGEKVSVEVNRQSFPAQPDQLRRRSRPTSTLTGLVRSTGSSTTATQSLSTPFSVNECSALAFKPSLTAFTGEETSRANGASLEVKISQGAGQAQHG